jgi:hypothetical protein
MRKKMGNFLLSRRRLIGGLGGAAVVAGLPGCGSGNSSNQPPYQATATLSDGYTDKQSYRPGDSVTLFINADNPQTTVLNLYNFANVIVHTVPAELFPQTPVGSTPWETGFGYQESVTFTLPSLPSGVYLVEGTIPVIVKTAGYSPTPSQQPEVVILYPTNTIAAYNAIGGRSMYSQPVPAPIVSFHRPMGGAESNYAFFDAFLEWLTDDPLPYSTGYIADIDLEDYSTLDGVKVLVVIGHSEYWTRQARENFDQFVLSGGNVLLLTGNNMWWQVRYSNDLHQMICYKEVPDPIANPMLKTINWTRSSLKYPTVLSVGADFPHGGFGLGYPDKGGFRVLSPNSPVFRGIFIRKGDVISIPTVEYDGAPLLNDPITEGGDPQLDIAALGAYRAEIIGYEFCSGNDNETGPTKVADKVATWIVYQRTATSGVIMNGASTNWCSRTGAFGTDGFRVRQIIVNMLESLVKNESLFVS